MAYSHEGQLSIQGQTLEMTVVGCYNLSNKEWFTKQDPYVIVEYSGQKFRTRTDTDGGKNPSFNETFRIALIEGLRDINATVWNSNTIERDDYIGTTKVLLSKVLETGYDDTQWSLSNARTGKSSGTLKLILHYAGSAKTKPGKFEGSSHAHATPAAPMYYGQPAPAYGPAAVHSYPPQQFAIPYPPPEGLYGPPSPAAQAYMPMYGQAPAPPAYAAHPPPPAQPSSYYPQASAPPYAQGPPIYPPTAYPPSGYPATGGPYPPQYRPY